MKELQDLTYWTVSRLQSLPSDQLLALADQSFQGLTRARLLLGRCLLAMKRTEACLFHGFSGVLHYCNWSGVDLREASEARRVADRLEELPRLRAAAEAGTIRWSQLREIVRKASAETEERWLELASRCSYKEIERLVARTREGEVPVDPEVAASSVPELTELRVLLPATVTAMVQMVVRQMSHLESRLVPLAEVIEVVFADYLAGDGVPSRARRERVRQEARRDVAAAMERESRDLSEKLAGADPAEAAPPWVALAATEAEVPGQAELQVLAPTAPHWANPRLAFRADRRHLTPAQRRELLRRDGYRCCTPGCPNHLWLDVHHLVFYRLGGVTVPENLLVCCRGCHRNLHRGLLKVSGTAPYGLVWTDSRGVPLDRGRR